MRVLGVADWMPPTHWAGSEVALWALLDELRSRGHEVACLVSRRGGLWKGVRSSRCSPGEQDQLGRWADVLVCQQGGWRLGIRLVDLFDLPAVWWSHTWLDGTMPNRPDGWPGAVAANSRAAGRALRSELVLRPLVRVADNPVSPPGPAVGQVNLNTLKGGEVFIELARRMPDVEFVARESWGNQVRPRRWPQNVTVQPMGRDMEPFWSRVGVFANPALGESWGRAAVEALARRRPVVANPTPGLREALAGHARWVPHDDLDGWERALREAFDDQADHRGRAVELERLALSDIDRFEEWASCRVS